jgi:hypothetical protein
MNDKPDKADLARPETAELSQIIQDRAYKLWQAEGSAEGRLEEYWHRAKELIEDEAEQSYPPSASRGHRT